MTTQPCPGCQRRLPVHNGIHTAELEMIPCTRPSPFALEPKSRDTWHESKKRSEAPFEVGGAK